MASTKIRRDLEKKMQEESRLPPGQALTLKFPVLDLGRHPQPDLSSWEFRIFGEVEEEVRWSWSEFNELPRTRVRMDLHCVTRWSKFDTMWEGVSFADLLQKGLVRPKPSARFGLQHAADGYTTNLPLEVMAQDNYLFATHFEDKPLTLEHGFPVRGVIGHIPDKKELMTPYLWKGAKWIVGLELFAENRPGFWEIHGYHDRADVWGEQRFA